MLRSSVWNYSEANIPVKGTITVAKTAAAAAAGNNVNKMMFKEMILMILM